MLTADKPFIRHITGKLSHNADCFGAPACKCTDELLFDFTRCKKTHHAAKRGERYEECCALSHTPSWEALGEDEPNEWSMTCEVCDKTWTQDGGYAELEAERACFARMDVAKRTTEMKKHADKHYAQQWGRPPLVPFHWLVFDPMHAIHCEVNVLLDEAVHRPLVLGHESKDPFVKQTCAEAQKKVNELWSDAQLPKFIQWGMGENKGKDKENAHALNGPTFKKAWAKPNLLLETMKAMDSVWELKEANRLEEQATEGETGVRAATGAGGVGQLSKTSKPKGGSKKRKDRGASFDEDEPPARRP